MFLHKLRQLHVEELGGDLPHLVNVGVLTEVTLQTLHKDVTPEPFDILTHLFCEIF